jgi:hypothetical protein
MITITPSLCAGTPQDALKDDHVFVMMPYWAVWCIQEGMTAVIPEPDWQDMARDILSCWVSDPKDIEKTIHFAETGRFG